MTIDPHTYQGKYNDLRISPTSDPGVVNVDLFNRAERRGFWMEVPVGKIRSMIDASTTTPADDMDGGVAAALIEKEVDRADALAKLEALGDDGTALRCAVMIAQAGAGEATVAEFCEQIARGDDVNVAARAERAEHLAKEHAATIEEQAALIEHLRAEKSECPDPEVHEGGPFDLAVIFRDERDEARAMAALWKKTAREHIGRARTALSYADAAQLARAVASVTPCSCSAQRARAEKAEAAYEDLREQYGTGVREKDEWEANAERAELEWGKAEHGLTRLARGLDLPDTATVGDMIARIEEINCHDCIRDAAVIREPRPLTPDAITDEMVERALRSWRARSGAARVPDTVRDMLTAALTEPPARPEGAVALAARLDEAHKGGGDVQDEADRLYAMGVRVVSEDGAA